ncbi:GGDEF domain-containing protein [Blastococcus tunisiensis]|uniref:Diguanylate cyclase (GGDEF) domain-containing protein n=1 Tax=Blastococcus tunisiensis TaxID=1798228 RepID=A0A1I2IXV1_9ACTN|nr:GGDEF domain-containing protein [Blastococcus sp. DSM 46838]SFF45516.1 diguanylate cyclase (GGDEF) domain-containing protein [Blastococcus sp. DSM 46838]
MGMRAREPETAGRSGVLILVVAAVVLAAFNTFQPLPYSIWAKIAAWSAVGLVLLIAAAVALVPAEILDRAGVYTMIAVGGVLLICGLNVLTDDPSAASQAFLAFPVLWAASHLERGAVVLVTGTAVAGDGVALLLLLPVDAAMTDLVFFGAVLVVMAVMLVRANTTQERLVAALQEQLTVDSLTGLATRRAFDGALETAMSRSVPGGTALVLIDVDSFKSINDTHGHPVGDDVLVHLASVLSGRVRAEDAVLSRLGGDELAVLMPGCGRRTAVQRARDLLEAVRSTPMTLADGTLLALSISVGVAHVPQHSDDRRGLYTAADNALYAAKRAGRGRVSVAAT